MGMTHYSYDDDGIRRSGILAHPTSFPSPYGIGDLGQGAYDFIDFLEKSGQTLWQVLPLGPTGLGNSPYSASSVFAGQPLIISPEKLVESGYLTWEEINKIPRPWFDPEKVDFEHVIPYKEEIFRMAFRNFKAADGFLTNKDYLEFYEEHKFWLDDYAFFMSFNKYNGYVNFTEWEEDLLHHTEEGIEKWTPILKDEIEYHKFLQFCFFTQWDKVHRYANSKNVRIIGDLPIFAAMNSADVWAHQDLYQLDSTGHPLKVAGVPPDYFSAEGQLWGNPLYKWEAHEAQNFSWWISRIKTQLILTDYVRIDHFRGLSAYWSVDADATTAKEGKWIPAPGEKLFLELKKELGDSLPIIAEDLGIITDEVYALRDEFGLPGMKVLQFGFESDYESSFLPHQFKTTNFICYTGTHDNNTTVGWYADLSPVQQDKVRRYMKCDGSSISWDLLQEAMRSIAKFAITPMQDILCLDGRYRMNIPGVATGNWSWRFLPAHLNDDTAIALHKTTELFGRLG